MRQIGEPSVEDILKSIKQVISRDQFAPRADSFRPDQGPSDDVFELSEDSWIEDEDEDNAARFAAHDSEDREDPPLSGESTRESMRESLAALAMMAEPSAKPQIVRSGETSLEGMVRELLRPALAEWLDKNLPPMVERMVAAEIARIVGKKV